METKEKEQSPVRRKLCKEAFKRCYRFIENSKGDSSLHNIELIENLIENYKDRTIQAPIEVITASALLLNTNEIVVTIKVLEHIMHMKMMDELKAKVKKGEATASDVMAIVLLK